jgi:hypothetical protein
VRLVRRITRHWELLVNSLYGSCPAVNYMFLKSLLQLYGICSYSVLFRNIISLVSFCIPAYERELGHLLTHIDLCTAGAQIFSAYL